MAAQDELKSSVQMAGSPGESSAFYGGIKR